MTHPNSLTTNGLDVAPTTLANSEPRPSINSTGNAILDFLTEQSSTIASQTFNHMNEKGEEEEEEEEEDVELDDPKMAELLRQLDEADAVANGLESRLDHLLNSIEGMLGGLEGAEKTPPKSNATTSETENSKVGSVEGDPPQESKP